MFLHFFVRSIIAFLFIGSVSGAAPQHVAHSVIGFYEQRDLELVESLNKTHQGVVACFDKTHFKQGRAALEQLLTHPTTDCTLLTARQKMIQGLSGEYAVPADAAAPISLTVQADVAQALPLIAQAIDKLAALDVFRRDTVAQQFLKNFYYQWPAFKGLNRTSSALDVKHAWSILWGPAAPLLEHALLHYALEYFKINPGCNHPGHNHEHAHHHEAGHGHAHGDEHHEHGDHHGHGHEGGHVRNGLLTAGQWAHFAYHAVSAYEALGLASQRIALINEIYQSLLALKQLLTIAQHLQKTIDVHEGMQLMHSTAPDALISRELDCQLRELTAVLNSSYFAPGASLHWYSLVGQTLKAYRLYEQNKLVIENLLGRLGNLDAFMSVATVVKASAGKPNALCFATFNEASRVPLFALKGVWNCMLGADRAVANDLVLSEVIGEAHMVLTGPNKAGKSSLLKSVAVAAVLAQSFGIVPAKSATITPFSAIITFMTVLDDIATDESSLIARILRADAIVKQLKNRPENGHALVLLDDSVGQGTSFQKGQEAAYNLFKTVGTSAHTVLIGATHFPRLTQLAPEMPGLFSNWRIRISTQPDGKKESAFVLEPGYSSPDQVYDLVYAQGYLNDN